MSALTRNTSSYQAATRQQHSSVSRRVQERMSQSGQYLRGEAAKIRILEFLMFFLMIFAKAVPVLGLPFNQLMIIVILAYGFFKKPVYKLNKYFPLMLCTFTAMGYLGLVSITHDLSVDAADWHRRLLRLILATILIWFVAAGRLHLRSAIVGYVTAILLNVPAYYAGIAPDKYSGFLTGYLEDKNFAGLVYCIFGLLILSQLRLKSHLILTIVMFSGILWVTGSRTSMAGFAMGIVWIILAKRIPVWGRMLLGVAIYFAIQVLTEDYAQAAQFADRAGTDWFRARIDEASLEKVHTSGIFGRGLGEAYVYLPNNSATWYFHNSYWSALVEGGWLWMLLVVGITVFCIVRPFSNAATWTRDEIFLQGAGIALLICAQRLGEVFYTWPWALCVGYAIRAAIISRSAGTPHEDPRDAEGIDGRIMTPLKP